MSKPITSITELRYLNKRNGHFWFEPDAMKFFGTRIESRIIGGKYFITSEKPPVGPRAFSIRTFNNEGHIETIGEFGGYKTLNDAVEAVNKI